MTEREFVFANARFYSVIDEGAARTTGPDGGQHFATPAVGVWAMGDLVTEIPPGAQRVVIAGHRSARHLDETGRPWQDRAVAAELAAADLRARLQAAEQRVALAESGERAQMAAMRAARKSDEAAWDTLRSELLTLAEQVADVYDRGSELGRMVVRCTGDHDNHPDGPGHDYDPSLCDVRSATAEELVEFMSGVLRLDHPSVRFPEPGPATIANACVLARTELAKHGGTLDDVAEAILRMAATPQTAVPSEAGG